MWEHSGLKLLQGKAEKQGKPLCFQNISRVMNDPLFWV